MQHIGEAMSKGAGVPPPGAAGSAPHHEQQHSGAGQHQEHGAASEPIEDAEVEIIDGDHPEKK
jgi:hypothetical protein